MKKDFVTEVKGMIMTSEFEMVKTLRMQQILAGYVQPDDIKDPIWFDDLPRLDALMEKIEACGKEKQIIWTVFRPTYHRIAKELEMTAFNTIAENNTMPFHFKCKNGTAIIVINDISINPITSII